MLMDLGTLKMLVSVAERGSLTAAAEERHLTQPALSIRLRKLQAELGVVLFEMRGRRVRLTRAGEVVLAYARRFAGLEAELGRELVDLEGLARGAIAMGTIDAASIYVLPRVFSRFRERYPAIDITLEITSTVPLLAALRAGRLDFVIGTLPIDGGRDLAVHPVYRERLVLIAPPGHRLARRRSVEAAELAAEPFISFHEGSITRRLIERSLGRRGVAPRATIATDSPEAIRNLVAAGLGLAVLPEPVVRAELRRGSLAALRVKGLAFERELGLIVPEGRYLPAAARAFLGVLAEGLRVSLPEHLVAVGPGPSERRRPAEPAPAGGERKG
jgi:DNA-binding transcriptional LysR family regulator